MGDRFQVYGVKVSYFTGKFETYLHYKGLEFDFVKTPVNTKEMIERVGTGQIPTVRFPDGRYATDTTPIIRYIESQHPEPRIVPEDAAVAYLSWLIEDYADEYLWRSAMHYRWSYDPDRELLCRRIADDVLHHTKIPRWLLLGRIKKRQYNGFVAADGVTPQTREHVEQGYLRLLDCMVAILRKRPYLLGDFPSIADIGLMGPMLRHFGQDPTPEEIMRERAPEAYEWVARMWNVRGAGTTPRFPTEFPADLAPLLQELCETHLAQLRENARAFSEGKKHFDATFQGCAYRRLPVSRYRVWCLEQLREQFAALPTVDAMRVRDALPFPDASLLWDDLDITPSGYDEERAAPFNRGINVYGKGPAR